MDVQEVSHPKYYSCLPSLKCSSCSLLYLGNKTATPEVPWFLYLTHSCHPIGLLAQSFLLQNTFHFSPPLCLLFSASHHPFHLPWAAASQGLFQRLLLPLSPILHTVLSEFSVLSFLQNLPITFEIKSMSLCWLA
jgi:hypothetical protein